MIPSRIRLSILGVLRAPFLTIKILLVAPSVTPRSGSTIMPSMLPFCRDNSWTKIFNRKLQDFKFLFNQTDKNFNFPDEFSLYECKKCKLIFINPQPSYKELEKYYPTEDYYAFWGITMESIGVRYTVPIHPVQIYYAIWFLGLSFLLFHMRRRKQLNVLPARLYKILGAKASSVQIHTSRSGMVTLVGIVLSCIGVIFLDFYRGDFAITVFAKFIDFAFLALLFVSLGTISVMEKKISNKHSMLNSIMVGMATMVYLIIRPYISIISFEWRFSQFLSVLAVLVTIVYVVVHRWKYQNH